MVKLSEEMAKLDGKAMTVLALALQWVYDKAIGGAPGLESAPELAAAYRRQFVTTEEAIDALIRWQVAKAATAGFLSNLGGVVTLLVAVPANVVSALYIQIRMVAAIAALRGHDLRSEEVKALILACLCGTGLMDLVKDAGIGIGVGLAQQAAARLSGEALKRAKQAGRFEALRHAGSALKLSRLAPLIGGLIAGAFDGALTRAYAIAAKRLFLPVVISGEIAGVSANP